MHSLRWHHLLPVIALSVFTLGGCDATPAPDATPVSTSSGDDHDHGNHDHDHDGHDHGDHDHGDHDHGDHDHGDHDHDHDHGDHDHGDHDHGDGAKTMAYGEAVTAIESFVAELKAAGSAEGDDMHGKMHGIFDVINGLDISAKAAEMDESVVKNVGAAKEKLLDALMAIDDVNHGREGSTYAEVSGDIEAAMKTLADAKK
ncbi:MAG: hypothetical protein AAF958_06800 [Planctomycetota bacterium]